MFFCLEPPAAGGAIKKQKIKPACAEASEDRAVNSYRLTRFQLPYRVRMKNFVITLHYLKEESEHMKYF